MEQIARVQKSVITLIHSNIILKTSTGTTCKLGKFIIAIIIGYYKISNFLF